MDYPLTLLRGIPNNTFIQEDGSIATHLLYFDDRDRRADGWTELSITWEDEDSALHLLLGQMKEGRLQFVAGAARLSRDGIDAVCRLPSTDGRLSYERSEVEGNIFHGNLLLDSMVSKPTMRKIAAGLALTMIELVPQSQEIK